MRREIQIDVSIARQLIFTFSTCVIDVGGPYVSLCIAEDMLSHLSRPRRTGHNRRVYYKYIIYNSVVYLDRVKLRSIGVTAIATILDSHCVSAARL
jgi:hypothetical protein